MSINNLVPLTRPMINAMNSGTRAQGSEGANVVTAGECAVLADELNVSEQTARRWFLVPDRFGRVPVYRNMVPVSTPPGNRFGYAAINRRIARMYAGTVDPPLTDPAEVTAMEALRHRCFLGAAMGTDGLSRDQTYYGRSFVHTDFLNTLWSCILTMDSIMTQQYNQDKNHGLFWSRAWVKIAITHRDVDGLPWVLTITAIEPDYADQYETIVGPDGYPHPGPAKEGKIVVNEDLSDAEVDARKAEGNPRP